MWIFPLRMRNSINASLHWSPSLLTSCSLKPQFGSCLLNINCVFIVELYIFRRHPVIPLLWMYILYFFYILSLRCADGQRQIKECTADSNRECSISPDSNDTGRWPQSCSPGKATGQPSPFSHLAHVYAMRPPALDESCKTLRRPFIQRCQPVKMGLLPLPESHTRSKPIISFMCYTWVLLLCEKGLFSVGLSINQWKTTWWTCWQFYGSLSSVHVCRYLESRDRGHCGHHHHIHCRRHCRHLQEKKTAAM